MSADDLVLTILTGRRPAYLKETVGSLLKQSPDVAQRAHVVLLVNGRDQATMSFVRGLDWVDELVILPGPGVLPIGDAISDLYRRALAAKRKIWMHLEDDWRCTNSTWLEAGLRVLEAEANVGQVRLRAARERVLSYHLVTKKPIDWQLRRGYRLGTAHYTFNPSLVRVADVARVFPCSGEPDAMRKFLTTKRKVAQLEPGAFVHVGEESLRGSLGRAE